jgi:glycogen operon protein
MTDEDWKLPFARCVGMLMVGQRLAERDARGNPVIDDDLLLLLNAHHEAIDFVLPGDGWSCVVDTAEQRSAPGKTYALQGSSLAMLVRNLRLD